MATTTKTAYLVYTGDYADNHCLSPKLCNRARIHTRLRAARRLGFKNAYPEAMLVSRKCRLLGDKTPATHAPQGMTEAEREFLKKYADAYAATK